MYYFSCFEKCKKYIKSTWSNIKGILNKKTSTTSISERFSINNYRTEDKQIIADRFNTYFTNIGATLENRIKNSGSKTFLKSYLDKKGKNNFNFTPVTETAVKNIIKQLIGKSDGLSGKLLKSIENTRGELWLFC